MIRRGCTCHPLHPQGRCSFGPCARRCTAKTTQGSPSAQRALALGERPWSEALKSGSRLLLPTLFQFVKDGHRMGLFDFLRNLLNPRPKPSGFATSRSTATTSPPDRSPPAPPKTKTLNLDAAQFAPISASDAVAQAEDARRRFARIPGGAGWTRFRPPPTSARFSSTAPSSHTVSSRPKTLSKSTKSATRCSKSKAMRPSPTYGSRRR